MDKFEETPSLPGKEQIRLIEEACAGNGAEDGIVGNYKLGKKSAMGAWRMFTMLPAVTGFTIRPLP